MTPEQWSSLKVGDKFIYNREDPYVGCRSHANLNSIMVVTNLTSINDSQHWIYTIIESSCKEGCNGHPTDYNIGYKLIEPPIEYIVPKKFNRILFLDT